ncbi:MAG: bifunctional 2-C-methyl-D-erythritol 4-phosphate cytidylyltransferase/2-C-methyl-D-erythritol 2,4-cyclodiphosphate synthase [Pseudomonadota bacterium]
MTTAAIIVAAGRGLRLGGPVPKQYQMLGGEMVLTRTVRAILACEAIATGLVAIHPDYREMYDAAVDPIDDDRMLPPVSGGAERADTVRLALEALQGRGVDRVLIHDAARPFVPVTSLARLCAAESAAFLAEPVVDALWKAEGDHADHPVPREGLWRAQTPQAFPFDDILEAHRSISGGAPTTDPAQAPPLDDVEVFRRAGGAVTLIPGHPDNFKITTAADMARAERLVAGEHAMETRTGHGFDVHRFVPGDGVWLCGVRIPHGARLDGHSDADVGLHALSDALYGALADGDIGTHFPPSDPQWKGAQSHVFLSHAAERVAARGGRIVNVDITLLCEAPKIAPHAAAMRARMSEIMGIAADRISVKATTMERMGFVGREEGMGCIATATVALPRGDA